MQVVLVLFRSDGQRRSFSVARDLTVIGRREDCDLRIPIGDISRKHCRLVKEADTIRLEDLGSSNGTYVNGNRVQEAILRPGDWIGVGPVQFVVQMDGQPVDDDIVPPPSSEKDYGVSSRVTASEDSFADVLGELAGGDAQQAAAAEASARSAATTSGGSEPTIDGPFDQIIEEPGAGEAGNDLQIDLDEPH
jgi:pSer/pThr/pTyr-binding forkhead associated (FHA) protein